MIIHEADKRITQFYSKNHLGIDLGFRQNEKENIVYSIASGVVYKVVNGFNNNTQSKGMETYGNYVVIKHTNEMYSRYAHLQINSINVKEGQKISKGEKIGIIGNSGKAYGRHLHFEIITNISNNYRINPYNFILEKEIIITDNQNTNDETQFKYHIVQDNDTVSKICRLYYNRSTKDEWDIIKKYNNLDENYTIYKNQKIKIPIINILNNYQLYEVQVGDTVSSICRKFYKKSNDILWNKIKEINHLDEKYTIYVGQVLKIPEGN